MTREETIFTRRIQDLAGLAWQRGITQYTDFLDLNEQNIFHSLEKQLSGVRCMLFGGYDTAERQMLAIQPDAPMFMDTFPDYESTEGDISRILQEQFPICCIRIAPLDLRFAEKLSHRDYLGSLMNLGVDRGTMGDILVSEDEACLFCRQQIAPFICGQLTRVRHTTVSCQETAISDIHYEPEYETITGTVATIRLDALLSLAFHSSRTQLVSLIEEGKTYVNGKLVTSNACRLQEGDIVSVRGYGRFRLASEGNQSRKGRTFVTLQKYQ